MGFIAQSKIQVMTSKAGKLCLKYPFMNKNGQKDFMYIEITDDLVNKIKEHQADQKVQLAFEFETQAPCEFVVPNFQELSVEDQQEIQDQVSGVTQTWVIRDQW